jgi:peptidoglycan/xylan/chitin deacetylase (PgdA/CDA1 family)
MPKEILCAFSVHCDAVAGWLGSYIGEDSPGDISRGVFAGEVGMDRILTLFERFGIKQSFFIPGHTIESFPDATDRVAKAGHEIGLHGYSHENPLALTRTQEEAIFDKCIGLIEKHWGRRPVGYVAPWWEVSATSIEILVERGIMYDHSLMHRDTTPYYVRTGDSWTPIDYSKPAETWMKPFKRGKETDLVEVPASWHLDDLPPMMFIKKFPNSHGYVSPRALEEIWRDHFDYVYRENDYAVVPMTIHPDVSGRPQVLLMLERLISYMMSQPGVRFVTLEDMVLDFKARFPRKGAKPAAKAAKGRKAR